MTTEVVGLRTGVRRPVSKDTPDRTDANRRTCPASESIRSGPNRTNRTPWPFSGWLPAGLWLDGKLICNSIKSKRIKAKDNYLC
jgi:hypothetical protein